MRKSVIQISTTNHRSYLYALRARISTAEIFREKVKKNKKKVVRAPDAQKLVPVMRKSRLCVINHKIGAP
jgi:hypothetical protein